jgi:hypothetical protein
VTAAAAILDAELRSRRQASIDELVGLAGSTPKSIHWRARARIGRRVPWYGLPEQVGR